MLSEIHKSLLIKYEIAGGQDRFWRFILLLSIHTVYILLKSWRKNYILKNGPIQDKLNPIWRVFWHLHSWLICKYIQYPTCNLFKLLCISLYDYYYISGEVYPSDFILRENKEKIELFFPVLFLNMKKKYLVVKQLRSSNLF